MVRALGAVVAAGVLAFFGGLINGEYPLSGPQPILLASLLGVAIGRSVAWIGGRGAPRWLIAVAVLAAVAGEMLAISNALAGYGPWPVVGYLSVAIAGAGAGLAARRIAATRPPGPATTPVPPVSRRRRRS